MNNQAQNKQNSNSLTIKDLIQLVVSNWYWFLISVVFFTGLGAFKILRQQPSYTRTAQILIKDQDTGGMKAPDLGDLSAFDLLNQTSNIWNELGVLQSPDMMLQVVNILNLNETYVLKKFLRDRDLYGDSIPVKIQLDLKNPQSFVNFKVRFNQDGTFDIKRVEFNGKKLGSFEGTFDKMVETPKFGIYISKNTTFPKWELPFTIEYTYVPPYFSALRHNAQLGISIKDKKASIIDLTYSDVLPRRADDILKNLIDVYNQDWVSDKKQIAYQTTMFINDRLHSIESELVDVDSDISNFKSENLITDLGQTSQVYLAQASQASTEIMEVKGQIYLTEHIKKQLQKMNNTQPLPTNTGVNNPSLVAQIANYNTLVVQRNSLASVSSDNNPVVKDMDANLDGLRASIKEGVDNELVALNAQLHNLQKYEKEAKSKIASNPKQAKQLLNIERQQAVKETLYLYLLQKREENELSNNYTIANAKIIKSPNGEPLPSAPRKSLILAASFLFGLFFPLGILVLREQLNTTVKSKDNLTGVVSIPVVGEIPLMGKRKYFATTRHLIRKYFTPKKDAEDAPPVVAVEKDGRNIINEAFRILRTTIGMMGGGKNQVISLTSMNPGSGKSFISMNLALTYAFKGNRVAVIDCDLRHGSLSKYVGSPREGLVDYLAGIATADKITVQYPKAKTLDVIPIGKVPPNPTELLENGKLDKLIEDFRGKYDVIILDCPPLGVVADTDIINHLSDRTLFVVRIGLLERELLPELERFYKEKRLNNLAIVVNGVVVDKSHFYYGNSGSYYYTSEK